MMTTCYNNPHGPTASHYHHAIKINIKMGKSNLRSYITQVFYYIPLGYSSFTCTGFLDSLDSAFFCFSFYQPSSGSTSKKKDEK